jgi:hypothetical protein
MEKRWSSCSLPRVQTIKIENIKAENNLLILEYFCFPPGKLHSIFNNEKTRTVIVQKNKYINVWGFL